MVLLATCPDLPFLDDRHATPCSRGDEFEQVNRAEPQVQPDMVVRITDSGVAYKEIVNWCARSTFYSEKAAWKEFDRRNNGCLHVTAYNPIISPTKSPTSGNSDANHFVGRTDLDYQESPAPGGHNQGAGGRVLGGRLSPGAISPKLLRVAGDATWDGGGGGGGAHLVVGDATYSDETPKDVPADADSGELHVTLPGHDIPVAENPCCMCAQEAGQERCPGCHATMCYMCISFFNRCSQCTGHVRSPASTPQQAFQLQSYASPVPPMDPRAGGANSMAMWEGNRAQEQDLYITANKQHQEGAQQRGPRPVPDPFMLGYPKQERGHLQLPQEQMQHGQQTQHWQQQQQEARTQVHMHSQQEQDNLQKHFREQEQLRQHLQRMQDEKEQHELQMMKARERQQIELKQMQDQLERERHESAVLQQKLMHEREELQRKMQDQMEQRERELAQLRRPEQEDAARLPPPQQQAHGGMTNDLESLSQHSSRSARGLTLESADLHQEMQQHIENHDEHQVIGLQQLSPETQPRQDFLLPAAGPGADPRLKQQIVPLENSHPKPDVSQQQQQQQQPDVSTTGLSFSSILAWIDPGTHFKNSPSTRNPQDPSSDAPRPNEAPTSTPYSHRHQLPPTPPMESAATKDLPPAPTLLPRPDRGDEQRDITRLASDHFERLQQELITEYESVMAPLDEAQEGQDTSVQLPQSKVQDVSASSLHSTKQLPPAPDLGISLQAAGAVIGSDWDDWPTETGITFHSSDIETLPESREPRLEDRGDISSTSDVTSVVSAEGGRLPPAITQYDHLDNVDNKLQPNNPKLLPRSPDWADLATTGGDASSKGDAAVLGDSSSSILPMHRDVEQIEPPARQPLEPPPRTSRVLEEVTQKITTYPDALPDDGDKGTLSRATLVDKQLEQKIKDLQEHLAAARAEMDGRVLQHRMPVTARQQQPAPSYDQISPEMRDMTANVVARTQARAFQAPTSSQALTDSSVFSDDGLPAAADQLGGDASVLMLPGHGASSQGTDWPHQEDPMLAVGSERSGLHFSDWNSSEAGNASDTPTYPPLPPPRPSMKETMSAHDAAARPDMLPLNDTKHTSHRTPIQGPLDLQMLDTGSPSSDSPRDLPRAYTNSSSSTPSTGMQDLQLARAPVAKTMGGHALADTPSETHSSTNHPEVFQSRLPAPARTFPAEEAQANVKENMRPGQVADPAAGSTPGAGAGASPPQVHVVGVRGVAAMFETASTPTRAPLPPPKLKPAHVSAGPSHLGGLGGARAVVLDDDTASFSHEDEATSWEVPGVHTAGNGAGLSPNGSLPSTNTSPGGSNGDVKKSRGFLGKLLGRS